MLVIALESAEEPGENVSWRGRRHDDEDQDGIQGTSAQGLFDAVFHALHDGEQVAVGVDTALTAPLPEGLRSAGEDGVLEVADGVEGGGSMAGLRHLLTELGAWRPWTAVTTSPQRWVATRSILVWEAAGGTSADKAVRSFFDNLHNRAPAASDDEPVVNLAVAAALRSGLYAERAELTRPALRIPA